MVEKLTIIRCSESGGQINPKGRAGGPETSDTFIATINPEKYKHTFSIDYSGERRTEIGKAGKVREFASVPAQKLDFDIVLDVTGVVPGTSEQTIEERMTKLLDIAYDYDGKDHETPVVQLVWGGGLSFFARLTSLNADYALFSPDGTALRANVSMNFISAKTEKEVSRKANLQSPDMSHLVQVKAGDTLPLLCEQIYKDSRHYMAVAAHNGLDSFRVLEPGTVLRFPPMR